MCLRSWLLQPCVSARVLDKPAVEHQRGVPLALWSPPRPPAQCCNVKAAARTGVVMVPVWVGMEGAACGLPCAVPRAAQSALQRRLGDQGAGLRHGHLSSSGLTPGQAGGLMDEVELKTQVQHGEVPSATPCQQRLLGAAHVLTPPGSPAHPTVGRCSVGSHLLGCAPYQSLALLGLGAQLAAASQHAGPLSLLPLFQDSGLLSGQVV